MDRLPGNARLWTYDRHMPLLLLICMIVACLPLEWPGPPFGLGPVGSAGLAAGVVALLLVIARGIALMSVAQLASNPGDRSAIARTYGLRRLLFTFLNLGTFWFVLLSCGWGWSSRELLSIHRVWPGGETIEPERYLLPGAELLVLAPYLMVLVGSWAIFFDAERALYGATPDQKTARREFWSRWAYVGFLLRHHLLMVFLPVFLVVFQLSVLRAYPNLLNNPWAKLGGFAALFLFILLVPSMVPLLLGLRPMPSSNLRDRLEDAAVRIGVRYRNLYVWDTRGNLATAMVTGLIPQLRQIVFTDLLLATLEEDEVEAVFGHEVGHVRHGHLLYYALFLMLSFLTLGATYRAVELSHVVPWFQDQWTLILPVLLTGCYLFLVFGFISRRCERQADVFGCKAVSCANPECTGHGPETVLVAGGRGLCQTGVRIFVRALERVEEMNGSGRGASSDASRGAFAWAAGLIRFVGVWLSTWQHGTIAKRIEFLKALDVQAERRFQWRVTALRCGLLVLLLAGIVGVAVWSGWQALLEGV